MAKVTVAVLAGKSVGLPHSEQGSRPVSFDENGVAYVNDFKRDKEGKLVLDKEEQPIAVQRELTKAEVEGLQEHYRLFGVVVS